MERLVNSTTARGALGDLGLEILADSCIFRLLHSAAECAEGFAMKKRYEKPVLVKRTLLSAVVAGGSPPPLMGM